MSHATKALGAAISAFCFLLSSFPQPSLTEEPQQIAVVWHRGGNLDPVDAAGAEAPLELLPARRRPPPHVGPAEVDEPRAPLLGVDDAGQRAGGKALLARVADDDSDDVVALVDPPQGVI